MAGLVRMFSTKTLNIEHLPQCYTQRAKFSPVIKVASENFFGLNRLRSQET